MQGKMWLLAAGACAVAGVVMAQGPGQEPAQGQGPRGMVGARGERPRIDFRQEMKNRFAEMDADKDGKVTFEEFKAFQDARVKDLFKRQDRNGDGVLTEDDFPKGPGVNPRPPADAPQGEPTEKVVPPPAPVVPQN